MKERHKIHKKNKKNTIFQFMLFPLIAIMLIQSMITIGTLAVSQTPKMLEDYPVSMMGRMVENRRVILQNDMNQRWASVRDREFTMNMLVATFLIEKKVTLEQVLASDSLKGELLERIFPVCMEVAQNSTSTGIFFILTDGDMQAADDYDGFFIRDSDPETSPANHSDLLLERGSKQLSRKWSIPLDTNWTTHFHMEGQGQRASDQFFYEPWRAGEEYPDADTLDLGFWSMPFVLEDASSDSHKMITYSVPLRYGDVVYGVLGAEVAVSYLYNYFPVDELNETLQSGYMLAVSHGDGSYTALAGRGLLYNNIIERGDEFRVSATDFDGLFLVKDAELGNRGIYAVSCPMKLYSNNVPYRDTEWVFLGLNTEDNLFGMSRRLYIWMGVAVLVGLGFGVICIYFLVLHLTRPIKQLIRCIGEGYDGLQGFKASNILEVNALYDMVSNLMKKQKEAENVLLEEKERYRIALESTKDTFFAYDFKEHVLDIVNNEKMSGQWKCDEYDIGFIDPKYIYDMDRGAVLKMFRSQADRLYVEFRIKLPHMRDYSWVAISGNAVSDAEGNRWKLVGSIRNIQEQKEREAEQLRKNTIDSVTGLYIYSAGMERLEKNRKTRPEGVMVNLRVEHLRDINEKNGIVFGDMVLEELGRLITVCCQTLFDQTGYRTVALRFDGDEFVLWLEKQSRWQAKRFLEDLSVRVTAAFDREIFSLDIRAGLVCAAKGQECAELIGMAKKAQEQASFVTGERFLFYEDIPEEQRGELPVLRGRDVLNFGYAEEGNLASLALNLFGKGADFPAQMALMLRKIGRYYGASSVLVTVVHEDFHSNYLEYQWNEDGVNQSETVHPYREEEWKRFHKWLGRAQIRFFDGEGAVSRIQSFLSIRERQPGVVLPMYDSGNYMGNLCILGINPGLEENGEEIQNLKELGNVIQSQLNQKQHDIASKAKSDFLSRMSHEIRTPMNGIIGMTDIALQKNQSQERILDCLRKIQSSSEYLLGLINDILDMSKIESGKMHLEPVNFSMEEMLDTIRELVMPQMNSKNIEFVQDIQLTHTWFFGDRLRISQVLINLLGNAVKFTPERGHILLTVRESAGKEAQPWLYFSVKDTGVGISEEDQSRVFRSFEQASNVGSSKQKGTGLGLSISSRLIQLMGSSIELDSTPGEGSTFSFTIPLEFGSSVEEESEMEEVSFEGYHILVVEDNELNSEIARSILEERGFNVDCVYDGSQAVERIRATEPGTYDVILMDIMMPVMDGLEATRAIRSMDREDCRTIPIIAMSANAFDDDLKKSVECGMNGHLSKPVEVDKLYQTLWTVLNSNQ